MDREHIAGLLRAMNPRRNSPIDPEVEAGR